MVRYVQCLKETLCFYTTCIEHSGSFCSELGHAAVSEQVNTEQI